MDSSMWFSGWDSIGRTLVVGIGAYAALVVLLRASGKRTLSKFNAFDFIVTVALGSILASTLTSRDVALAQGVFAFALLAALQFLVSVIASRSPAFRRIVTSEPRLLAYRGRVLRDALRAERLDEEEVLAAVRSSGNTSLDDVEAVVLETDGSVSVMAARQRTGDDALRRVDGFPPERGGRG